MKDFKKIAKKYSTSKKYVELLYNALKDVDELESFDELLKDGVSKDVQIQFLNDNFTERKLKMSEISFWIDSDCKEIDPVFLTSFVFKNRIHLLVYQN